MIKLRVKEILKEKGLTAKDLANELGITEVGLSKSLSEKGNPTITTIHRIATALNVTVPELFEQPATDVINCPNCGTKLKIEKV